MAAPLLSFDKFKQSFYDRVPDLQLFNADRINLLKVVLDGLKVDYAGKGKVRVILFQPLWWMRLLLWLLRIRKGNETRALRKTLSALRLNGPKKFMVADHSGRVYTEGGSTCSFYCANVVQALGRSNVHVISEGSKRHADDVDLKLPSYNLQLLAAIGLNSASLTMLQQLRKAFTRIQAAGIFTEAELLNIQVGFQQFFLQYVCWSFLLKETAITRAYVWPHYHREGSILAFRDRGIEVIELQHGLIAEEDVFYGFPARISEVKTDLLFADRILVYGEFWKEQLLKGHAYKENQIILSGYFPHVPAVPELRLNEIRSLTGGLQIILITTQTYMHDFFIRYIQFLSADLLTRNLPYCIAVKFHPAEKPELYKALAVLSNVIVVTDPVDVLMKVAALHVSVYSTTMFDALRSGVVNYSVYYDELGDYIRMFSREGVCTIIQPDENPLDYQKAANDTRNVEFYYSTFNPQTLLS